MRRRGSIAGRAYGLPVVLRAVRGGCLVSREGRVRRLTPLAACALVWMLFLTVTPEVRGQQFTGGLRGAVKDASAVIPGVAVTLINQETNASRTTVSNVA